MEAITFQEKETLKYTFHMKINAMNETVPCTVSQFANMSNSQYFSPGDIQGHTKNLLVFPSVQNRALRFTEAS